MTENDKITWIWTADKIGQYNNAECVQQTYMSASWKHTWLQIYNTMNTIYKNMNLKHAYEETIL